jgi:hypothetical protein
MNQRWIDRRHAFRPDEPINPARYEVIEIEGDTTARGFVERHHYSGSYPAARRRYGLIHLGPSGDELHGVAVFSHPCREEVLTGAFGPGVAAVELGCFVLLDEVPGNGETWFLGRCFDRLTRAGFRGVISFSDPVARRAADGAVVFPGHYGCIYQAHNARYAGRSAPRTLSLLPDGRVLSERAKSKIRRLERGWEYAAKRLLAFGADAVWMDDPAAWLAHWLSRLARPLRHPGNHRYLWGLDRLARRMLPAPRAYPKPSREFQAMLWAEEPVPSRGDPPARTPKIKIPLANDFANGAVTVAGEESIDLDDAESLLKEALKAVRAAGGKNLDCKTAQSVWRDMAKAGSPGCGKSNQRRKDG